MRRDHCETWYQAFQERIEHLGGVCLCERCKRPLEYEDVVKHHRVPKNAQWMLPLINLHVWWNMEILCEGCDQERSDHKLSLFLHELPNKTKREVGKRATALIWCKVSLLVASVDPKFPTAPTGKKTKDQKVLSRAIRLIAEQDPGVLVIVIMQVVRLCLKEAGCPVVSRVQSNCVAGKGKSRFFMPA